MLWETQQADKIKISLIFFFIFIVVPVVFASCSDIQIDINSASLEELDELYGIGPVKAQAIIDTRPFDSIDNLIDVYGIGEVTLQNIKEQDLACVENQIEEEEAPLSVPQYPKGHENTELGGKEAVEEEIEAVEPEIQSNQLIDYEEEVYEPQNEIQSIKIQTISLNAKDIKSGDNNEEKSKSSYAIYGFAGFCVLLGFLYLIKRKSNKNGLE